MYHEHSVWPKKAKELSSEQRGSKVLHYVKQSIEKLNTFVSAPSNASSHTETISIPCTVLGLALLPPSPAPLLLSAAAYSGFQSPVI